MSDQEREDLKDLLKHPGWLRLVTAEKAWWDENLGAQLAVCANDANDVAALNKMRQLVAAKQAVDRFIARPSEMLKRLEAPQPQPTLARGGYSR